MIRRFFNPSYALAGVVAFTSYYGFRTYSSIALPSGLSIVSSDQIPYNFAHSLAVSTVNPRRHITINDTRSVIAPVSNNLSHEQILAKFFSGFFGGYVLAPERVALRLLGQQLVKFKGELESQPLNHQTLMKL